jgi:hypothetical protein
LELIETISIELTKVFDEKELNVVFVVDLPVAIAYFIHLKKQNA